MHYYTLMLPQLEVVQVSTCHLSEESFFLYGHPATWRELQYRICKLRIRSKLDLNLLDLEPRRTPGIKLRAAGHLLKSWGLQDVSEMLSN